MPPPRPPFSFLPPLPPFPWEPSLKLKPEPDPKPEQKQEDDLVIVVRKKGKRPTWLKGYQEKMRDVSRRASKETAHLRGQDRVRAMNALVGKYIRET